MTSLSTGFPESALYIVQANYNRAYTSLCYINFFRREFSLSFILFVRICSN